jgi:mitochondrial distribution and morphology protein 31
MAVILATANSLSMQGEIFRSYPSTNSELCAEYIAKMVSDYLSHETGVTIIFESAIVPKWSPTGVSFKNVFISRRPASEISALTLSKTRAARARHRIAAGYDVANHPSHIIPPEDEEEAAVAPSQEEDSNYAMFDFNIDSIDVTLSLRRWLDGKGLVKDAVVRGVRGVLGACQCIFW